MKFTSGNISLMSSLASGGTVRHNHGPRGGGEREGPWSNPQGLILSGNFRTSPGLKTRMKITLEVPSGCSSLSEDFLLGSGFFCEDLADVFTP